MATWTSVLGWPVQGIWAKYSDNTDVNAVDRSHSGSLLVTAEDTHLVKLFRFPCLKKSVCKEYKGHMSHVMCVRFLHDDTFVVSAGGNDCAVVQWRHSPDLLQAAEQEFKAASRGNDGPRLEKAEWVLAQFRELQQLEIV